MPPLHHRLRHQVMGTLRMFHIGGRTTAMFTIGLGVYGTYKANYDPLHIVWDLDHTILCSVTPIDQHKKSTSTANNKQLLEFMDHIDDDFEFVEAVPNTRTYFRPGALSLIAFTRYLGAINHVYTAAQGSYTHNILLIADPDETLFRTVTHRGLVPHFDADKLGGEKASFKGKDLKMVAKANQAYHLRSAKYSDHGDDDDDDFLRRAILFDDRAYNFDPQPLNGVHVKPYTEEDMVSSLPLPFVYDLEVGRMALVLFACHFAGDVRAVLPWFRSHKHNSLYPLSTSSSS
mmetsp:Transcript_5802/g.7125  ORF Transcript_5802/g.7125 Transcript_5802/m.7125 type:complete len:289 (+) Transcript_5802:3857-4723(+)